MIQLIEPTWRSVLQETLNANYYKKLKLEIEADYLCEKIYPPQEEVFAAFEACPFDKVKVVIIGQDPYHGPEQAHGLAFSVPGGVKMPPSLKNIYKELAADLDLPIPQSGNLSHWAQQGVLLLNATLTVQAEKAGSHQGRGWEQFTDTVIKKVSDEHAHVVFLLWGNFARSKANLIDKSKHLILEAAHPSPLSARNGFFGCKHFSKTNEYLTSHGQAEIQW